MKELEERFILYRQSLKDELVFLASLIVIYKRLHVRHHDRIDEMNIAPAFFQITMTALFSCIVIWVDKLFDEKSERGLFNFLGFIENNREVFDTKELQRRRGYPDGHAVLKREQITYQTIKSDRESIKQLDCLESIKLLRDKYYAHFDKEHFFDKSKLINETSCNWSDFDAIIKLASNILNNYSSSFDGQLYVIEASNVTDVDYILDYLHKYRQTEN